MVWCARVVARCVQSVPPLFPPRFGSPVVLASVSSSKRTASDALKALNVSDGSSADRIGPSPPSSSPARLPQPEDAPDWLSSASDYHARDILRMVTLENGEVHVSASAAGLCGVKLLLHDVFVARLCVLLACRRRLGQNLVSVRVFKVRQRQLYRRLLCGGCCVTCGR